MSSTNWLPFCSGLNTLWALIDWGRFTDICKLIIIGSDNGLSPVRHQAIIWTNAGILLIGPLATSSSEILIKIHIFSFKKKHLNMSFDNGSHFVSASMCELNIEAETKWPPFCRWYIQMHFLEWKCSHFNWNFTDVSSLGSNYWTTSQYWLG